MLIRAVEKEIESRRKTKPGFKSGGSLCRVLKRLQ
jgi:hypothetical protein